MAMKYLPDPDLDFLETVSNEDLDPLFKYLTIDKDGVRRITGDLLDDREVIRYEPNHHVYWEKIATELQLFGGNTPVNLIRGHGVSYRELLIDVCNKLKVNFNEKAPTPLIEEYLLMKIMISSLEKMNEEELANVVKEMKIPTTDFSKQALTVAIQAAIAAGGFTTYMMAVIVANQIAFFLLKRGLTYAANAALTRSIGAFAGPIGWVFVSLWTIIDIAGPAYRVTTPCVLHIAYLRIKAAAQQKEQELAIEPQG